MPEGLTPYARLSHTKAARALSDALTLGDRKAYKTLIVIWRSVLKPEERVALAWVALLVCDDEEALEVAMEVLPPEERAGWPSVPLDDVVDGADFWASLASRKELIAFALAILRRLPRDVRGAIWLSLDRSTAA